jgi:hypothetical protein
MDIPARVEFRDCRAGAKIKAFPAARLTRKDTQALRALRSQRVKERDAVGGQHALLDGDLFLYRWH